MSYGEIIVMVFLFGSVLVFGIYGLCVTCYYNHYNKKFTKNHADYLELERKVIDKGNFNLHYYKLIDQKKKAIDEALDSLKYMTAEGRKKVEEQIEVWRKELAKINEEARPHFEEHILLRDKLNKWHDELVASGELKEF